VAQFHVATQFFVLQLIEKENSWYASVGFLKGRIHPEQEQARLNHLVTDIFDPDLQARCV